MRSVVYIAAFATIISILLGLDSNNLISHKISHLNNSLEARVRPLVCNYFTKLQEFTPGSFALFSIPISALKNHYCRPKNNMHSASDKNNNSQNSKYSGSSSQKVRILTQNIFIRPNGINNNGNDYKTERLEYFAKNLLDSYDIICFQELFRFEFTSRYSKIVNATNDAGYKYHVSAPKKGLFNFGIDAGLTIFSRFPIVETDFKEYERGVHADYYSLKGVLYAKIKVSPISTSAPSAEAASDETKIADDNYKYIHLFNTHTQSSYGTVDLTQKSVVKRLYQLGTLHDFVESTLEKYHTPGEPVFITGDMNVDSRTHVIAANPGDSDDLLDSSTNVDVALSSKLNKKIDNENSLKHDDDNISAQAQTPNDPKKIHHSHKNTKEEDVRDGKQSSLEYLAFVGAISGNGIPDPSLFGLNKDQTFEKSKKFSLVDLFYNSNSYHPITFGNTMYDSDGNIVPMETVLTTKNDNMVMHSLDYILYLQPLAHDHTPATNSPQLSGFNVSHVSVQPHFATVGNNNFTQISDHYGVSADLDFGL
ncbi:Sphingomyelinase [Smittium culicis]|uniref:sphingomyelin phosphodiesterase n=1 Tax=Smittium culicis TaxID=133412 RepID=A0A1R1YQJ8_9FUNG|nr:Sphingomyelinase [Smittium culicis]